MRSGRMGSQGKHVAPDATNSASRASSSGVAAATRAGKEAPLSPAIAEKLTALQQMCDANKVSMAQLQLRMDKEAEEKDAQIANLTQLTEQLQQDAVRLTRENAQLRQVNTQILDRVPAQARAQQQQEGATPQSQQQQQQRLGQQPQARAQQRNKLVVVLGGAEDADDNAVLAGVTAAAGLAHDAVEKVVRSGPVWLLHLRDESAALRLLDSKQAVANLAETQQQQEPAVEGGESRQRGRRRRHHSSSNSSSSSSGGAWAGGCGLIAAWQNARLAVSTRTCSTPCTARVPAHVCTQTAKSTSRRQMASCPTRSGLWTRSCPTASPRRCQPAAGDRGTGRYSQPTSLWCPTT